ncbi:YkvA family protein [Oceanobacillus senegalensis]|uniref:YkvA family protein n=1 Tax=Oceanobacillus senegalensis TaxID=1936063 RepID=UPI000A30F055|nr:YkvA family protein [Oceanobacillus senegalensis]
MEKIKAWAKNLKRQTFILYFAYKDNRVPWYAKVFIVCVISYAFSPIDLIPDFIPIIGYLDDVIIVPLGIMFTLKMIPKDVIANCEMKEKSIIKNGKPKNWVVGVLIILIWSMIIFWIMKEIYLFLNEEYFS